MTPHSTELIRRIAAGLAERRHLLAPGFACDAEALQIALRYRSAADGTSGFWVVRARQATASAPRTVYEVVRSDGRIGVWDALTQEEGDIVADVLTKLSL